MRLTKSESRRAVLALVMLVVVLALTALMSYWADHRHIDPTNVAVVARATEVNLGPLNGHVYATIDGPWVTMPGPPSYSFHVYAVGEKNPQHRIDLTTCRLDLQITLTARIAFATATTNDGRQLKLTPGSTITSVGFDNAGHDAISVMHRIKLSVPPDLCQTKGASTDLHLTVTGTNTSSNTKQQAQLRLPATYFRGFMHKANRKAANK